ncbi:MAG: MFS transporter [Rhodospirillaceae bacterium]|nr:MFS transporter [Rhodospirillaceae bacterium]
MGVFGPSIQAAFDIDDVVWPSIYMVGTLASALILPWTGKLTDQVDLRRYTLVVLIGFVFACVVMASVQGVVMLIVAIFLLRQTGQGLMSHIAATSMARYHDDGRGRALAIASLGESIGEAVLPILAALAISWIGWRGGYFAVAFILVVVLIPLLFWLLKGHGARHEAFLARRHMVRQATSESARSATRGDMLRDPRFYLLLPGLLAPSMITTALFIYHLKIADSKGWSDTWITGN